MKWATKTKRASTAQKSANLGSWSSLAPWLNVVRGDQLSRTKWGAAKAYIVIGYVEKCVELIASGITSLPYTIKRFDRGIAGTDDRWTGTEIARSDDPIPQHPLFQLFHAYEDDQHMSFLFRVAASLTLFDELYIELVRKHEDLEVSHYNPLLALDWLNPLGMSLNAANGKINEYFYSPFDTARPATFKPFEIAYKHGYNPEDDLRGYPDVLAILESLEIDFAIKTSVVSHFQNGLQASAVVSPKEGFGNLQATREGLEDVKKRSRGPENVGGFMYWPKGIDVTALNYPDYSQLTKFNMENGDIILNQFGVSRAILGNSDIAGYKQGNEVTYRFYVGNIIPRADDIVKFFNRRIIPLLPPEYHLDRLVVDRSEFDRVSENDEREARIAGLNLKNMVVTINQARVRQGMKEFPPERGDLLIVPAGTIFVSPDDLKSGFIAGGTPEEAAVVEQTSDVEGDGDLPSLSPDEDEPPPFPPTDPEPPGAPPALPSGQKNNLTCVKAVMARSRPTLDKWDWSIEKAQKELDAWYIFIKRRGANGLKHLAGFEPYYTRGDIADTVLESFKGYNKAESGLTVKAIFGMVKDWVAIKAIQATRIDFEDDFEDTLQVLIDGKATPRQASTRLRSIIRKANNKAYRDGLEDGGVPGEEPTDAEQVEINQFISEQSQFVSSLIKAVKSEKLASSEGKGVQWYNKSVVPMYQAGLASAGANMMVEWVLGRTETHCRSCLGYNGQRHRLKTFVRIGAMPQSDMLVCHGDNCDCGLVNVRAKARGKLKLIKSTQALMKAKPFSEADVSRDEAGQFSGDGSGGGGAATDDKPKPKEPKKPGTLPEQQQEKFETDQAKIDEDFENGVTTETEHQTQLKELAEAQMKEISAQAKKSRDVLNDKLDAGEITPREMLEQKIQLSKDTAAAQAPHFEQYKESSAALAGTRLETGGAVITDLEDNKFIAPTSGEGVNRTSAGVEYSNITPDDTEFFQMSQDAINDMPDDNKVAMRLYTGGMYRDVNDDLRGIRTLDSEDQGRADENIAGLDSSMDLAGSTTRDMRLYRGGDGKGLPNGGIMSDDEFLNLGGAHFGDDGYTSTSINPSQAFDREYIFEFLAPRGTRGMYIDPISKYTEQDEFLLGRGSRYQIVETAIDDEGRRNVLAYILPGE